MSQRCTGMSTGRSTSYRISQQHTSSLSLYVSRQSAISVYTFFAREMTTPIPFSRRSYHEFVFLCLFLGDPLFIKIVLVFTTEHSRRSGTFFTRHSSSRPSNPATCFSPTVPPPPLDLIVIVAFACPCSGLSTSFDNKAICGSRDALRVHIHSGSSDTPTCCARRWMSESTKLWHPPPLHPQ